MTQHKEQRKTQRRESDDIPKSCQRWIADGVIEGVQKGVENGLKAVFHDEEFCEKFWVKGHQIFLNKTAMGVHLWLGKRFLQWATGLTAVLGGVIWVVAKLV